MCFQKVYKKLKICLVIYEKIVFLFKLTKCTMGKRGKRTTIKRATNLF
jgi:hypothetical protein